MVCCLQLSHFPRFWDLFPWYLWVWPYSWQIYKPKDLSESGKNRAAPCCDACHAWCREKWKEVTSSGDLNEESQQVFHIHKTRQKKRRIKQPLQKSFCGRAMTVNSSHIEWWKDSRFGVRECCKEKSHCVDRGLIGHWQSPCKMIENCALLWISSNAVSPAWSISSGPFKNALHGLRIGWDIMLSMLMHACRLHIYTQNSAVASSVHWSCNSSKMYQRSIGRADVSPWSPWRWPRWYWFDSCWYLGRQCQKGTID